MPSAGTRDGERHGALRRFERPAEREFALRAGNVGADHQTAGPYTGDVAGAAAVFLHFKRAYGESAAKIGGFVEASRDNSGRTEFTLDIVEIGADELREFGVRLRRWGLTAGLGAGSQGESRKQKCTQDVSPRFAAI